jgi:intergrase/recombinase
METTMSQKKTTRAMVRMKKRSLPIKTLKALKAMEKKKTFVVSHALRLVTLSTLRITMMILILRNKMRDHMVLKVNSQEGTLRSLLV